MKLQRFRQLLFWTPLILFALLNLKTQQYYVDRSRAIPSREAATFVEIPDASASHLLDEFSTLEPLAKRPGTIFISDTFNIVYAKIENFYTKPAGIIFPSDDFLRANFVLPTDPILLKMLIPSLRETALNLSARRQRHYRRPFFDFTRPNGGRTMYDGFFADNRVPELERNPKSTYVIIDTALQSMLNRWYNSDYQKNFDVVPLAGVHNHLIFIAAQYGLAYYSRSRFTSLFQLEPDVFYDGTMAGIGRRFLFDIINPSKRVRLEMSYTETLKDDGKCILYKPSILGASSKRIDADVVGRGSARVFFPPVQPRILVGQPYVLLDMNVNGTLFPARRTWLMRLYGLNYPLDARRLVGFGRDISAISEDEYDRLRRPSFLSDPPADLLNQNLEYSGAYEDGWISEASQYVLALRPDSKTLVIRGVVPLIGDPEFHSGFRVLMNGRLAGQGEVGIGTFEARFPINRQVSSPVKIKLIFDRFQRLPVGDDRPVSMKLYALGFLNARDSASRVKSAMLTNQVQSAWWRSVDQSGVQFGNGWYPLENYDGQTFRWANNDAGIIVKPTKKTTLVVDVEPGPGLGGRPGVLHLIDGAGHDEGSAMLSGRQLAQFALPQGTKSQSFLLHIEGGGTKVPSDPRILDFRVFRVFVR